MNTVEVNGVRYIKASAAAKEVGYTADYVGQLCRKDLVDATLVGRTWYVREGAIAEYKKKKSRLNGQKTIKQMEAELKQTQEEENKIHKSMYVPGVTPEYRQRLLNNTSISYQADDVKEDLFPTPQKKAEEGEGVSETQAPEEVPVSEDAEDTQDTEDATRSVTITKLPALSMHDAEDEAVETEEEDTDEEYVSDDAYVDIGEEPLVSRQDSESEYRQEVTRMVSERRSMLPMLATTLGALFLVASFLVQSVWIYDHTGESVTLTSSARFEASYAVASLIDAYEGVQNLF